MALPVFIGAGVVAVTGLAGIGNIVSAKIKTEDSREINQIAAELIEQSKISLEKYRCITEDCFKSLGETKLKISSTTLKAFVKSYSKLKSVNQSSIDFINLTTENSLSDSELAQMDELTAVASALIKGGIAGVSAGALVGIGVYKAAVLLGISGTGTAISALSGVAANNAALAWIGGGTLAAGGLGVTGGSVLLGGLIAGPALFILGGVADSSASKNLNNAHSSLEEAKIFCGQVMTANEELSLMAKCAIVLNNSIVALARQFSAAVREMTEIIDCCPDWNNMTDTEKDVVIRCMNYAKEIKLLLDIPLMDQNGNITEDVRNLYDKYRASLNASANDKTLTLEKRDLIKWKKCNADMNTEEVRLIDPAKHGEFLKNIDLPDSSAESYYIIAAVNRNSMEISRYSIIPKRSVRNNIGNEMPVLIK